MTATINPSPVRKVVEVSAPPEKAFDVFTSGIGRWWPRSYSIGTSPLRSATIEPRVGGRWFEVGEDGSECEWGEVLAWEPPTKLVLAWRIGPDWRYQPSLLTEVEVIFSDAGAGRTRVQLEHRMLENMGPDARATFEGGWPGLLQAFAEAAGQERSGVLPAGQNSA